MTTQDVPYANSVAATRLRRIGPTGKKRIWEGTFLEQTLVVALIVAYFLRVSSIPMGITSNQLELLCYGALILLVVYIVVKGGWKLNPAVILLAAFTLPSVFQVEHYQPLLFRWFGWMCILAVAGPLFQGDTSRRIRRMLLHLHFVVIPVVALSSLIMYVTGRSLGGRGGFSGLTSHALVMGTLAALTAVEALRRARFSQHRQFWLLGASLMALIPVISGARSALLGMACGFAGIAHLRKQSKWIMVELLLLIAAIIIFSPGHATPTHLESMAVAPSPSFFDRLRQKGLQNTREFLWEARWKEFQGSPLFGVGFQYQLSHRGIPVVPGDSVEPGSSYLAVFSMTGISGAFGLLLLAIEGWRHIRREWRYLTPAFRELLVSWWLMLAVYMVSEGFIFAVGYWFCLILWLLVGLLFDLSSHRLQSIGHPEQLTLRPCPTMGLHSEEGLAATSQRFEPPRSLS